MIKSILDNEEDVELASPKAEEKIDASDIFGIKGINTAGSDEDPHEMLVQAVDPPPPMADYTPPSSGESVRMSGLAWSAGVSLFGSIIAMMLIGWLIDLLVGSSPWGIVGGIVFGAILGFIQFFRINSEIFRKNKDSGPNGRNNLLR